MAREPTPVSAILFGIGVLGLIVAYVAIAFLYVRGWETLLAGAIVAAGLFLGLALLYLVAVRWTRSGAPP